MWYDSYINNDEGTCDMSSAKVSLKWCGREVRSFWGRAAIGALLALTYPLMLALLVATVPLHVALVAMGRQGFLYERGRGDWGYVVDRAGFARV